MICIQILGVHRKTSNIAVLLELGRVPLNLYAIKSAIKNWERVKSGNANVHVSSSHEDAFTKDLLWVRNIINLLEQNGLGCFYHYDFQITHYFIYKKIFQRLSDKFHQDAFSTLKDNSSKLRTYGLIKTEVGMEGYLSEIPNPSRRQPLTRFRLSNHALNIEKGWHNNIPRDLRYCPFCPTRVETEIHFLLECNAYVDERNQLLEPLPSIEHIPSLPKRFTYILYSPN